MLDLAAYVFARVAIALLAAPPLRAVQAFGRALGALAFFLRFRRSVVLANLRHVFGASKSEAELREIARRAYRNFGMTFAEVFRAAGTSLERTVSGFEVIGEERLREAQARGEPLIFAVPHHGNFDVAGYLWVARGLTTHFVMKPLAGPHMNDLLVRARRRHGLALHLTDRPIFGELTALVGAGKWVAILPDQHARASKGVPVRFLGKPASIYPGPARLHLATGAPIVACVVARRPDDPGRHVVTCRFLPKHEPTADPAADARAVSQAMCDVMGEEILKDPGQYFWFHHLWGKGVPGSDPTTTEIPRGSPKSLASTEANPARSSSARTSEIE